MEENKEIKETLKNEAGELTDEQLDEVAGGVGRSYEADPKTPDPVIPIV